MSAKKPVDPTIAAACEQISAAQKHVAETWRGPITEASTLNTAIMKVRDITRDMDPTDALQVASSVVHQIARAQDTPPGYRDKLLVIFRQLDRFADSW